MAKVWSTCDYCGKAFKKQAWEIHEHNFCCFDHFRHFASERMAKMNEDLNPTRMTPATRAKLRKARLDTGVGVTYVKEYSRHAHRVAMERKLGRKLKPGEVVHHIDGNKRNNDPENLMLFASIAEHSRYHKLLDLFFSGKGGDLT